MLDRLVKGWPCLLSALLLHLAFPMLDAGFLVFVALVPWFVSLAQTDRRGAWKSGYLFGVLFGLDQMSWIGSLAQRWTGQWALGLLPWVLASLAFAIYFGWAGILIRKCLVSHWYWMIPIVWAGIEAFRSYIPVFAFPWALLATPLWKFTPLIQSAHFGMIYLTSAWVVLANVLIVMAVLKANRSQIWACSGAFALMLVGSIVWSRMPVSGTKFVVTAIQPGVDMAYTPVEEIPSKLRNAIQPALDHAATDGTQLIVLPEGVVNGERMPPEPPFQAGKVPFIAGGRRGIDPKYQSAFGFDGTWKYVDKTRLVIFGEFVPGRGTFPFLASAFKLPSGDLSAGQDGVKALKVEGTTVGPLICFEGLFPDIAYRQALNGSKLLTEISIDDWYFGTAAPDQLMNASVWRAVETGLPLVRVGSMGITIATDAKGRLVAQAPARKPRSVRQELVLPSGTPTFPGLPIFPVAAFAATLGLGLLRPKAEPVSADE